jgi:4,5-dihydroxyphthalate decarboxylase
VRPLFPHAQAESFGYFRKTGVYPINHGVVVKDSVLKERPEIADELCRAFETSKAEYLKGLDASTPTTSWDIAAKVNKAVVGDPFPFGIEPNRKALEAMTQFAVDQKMVPRRFSVEELFVPAG